MPFALVLLLAAPQTWSYDVGPAPLVKASNLAGTIRVEAIQARDYPVVQAVVLVGTGAFVVSSILADLLYSLIDPRIRLSG